MGFMSTQVGGRTVFMLIGETAFVLCVVQHSKWRTSITFCLIALHEASFELVMPKCACSVSDGCCSREANACGEFITNCVLPEEQSLTSYIYTVTQLCLLALNWSPGN